MISKCSSAFLCVTVLLCLLFYQSGGETDLESIISEIFNPKNSCTCVPHDRCNNTNTTFANEEGIIDNNRDNGTSKTCKNISDICCTDNHITTMELTAPSAEKTTEKVYKSNNTESSHNTSCTCVPYYLCNTNGTGDSKPGIIDIRDIGYSTSCKNYLDVCCEENDIVMELTAENTTEKFKTNTTGSSHDTSSCTCVPYYLCDTSITDDAGLLDIRQDNSICESYLEICCKRNETVEVPVTPPPRVKKVGCGSRNPDGIGFKINDIDFEAQYGEFPWMAAVLRKMDIDGTELNIYQCGAALIHPQVVMTAAHCVGQNLFNLNDKKLISQLKIRLGEWDTQTRNELYPHQEREVSSVIIHPEFNKGRLYNDIALMFLETPVIIEENVQVVCLPTQNEVIESSKCFASGWGKNVFGKKGKYQVILKKVDLPMMIRSRCQENLRKNTKLGRFFELHQSFVCAGGESGKDTCHGDGGSPLVCPIRGHEDKERYAQVGIVAWGSGCGEANVPGVYVNVAFFRDWIDEQMKLKNLDPHSYQIME